MTQVYSPYFLSKIRPIRELSKSQNNYLDQLERIIQQLYQRSGAETDAIAPAADDNIANATAISQVSAQIKQLRKDIQDLQSETNNDALVKKLLRRIDDVENSLPIIPPIQHILKRLDDIEAQL